MAGGKTLTPKDVIYWYDGSYEGFLCCVFQCYQNRERPCDIWQLCRPETSLFPQTEILTDPVRAARVEASIRKMGQGVRRLMMYGFLNDSDGKELKLLRFLELCYQKGPRVMGQLAHPDVAAVMELEQQVSHEACKYREVLRFQERERMLGAVIRPHHCVLPLLQNHFCDRLPEEDFVIFDNSHYLALLKRGKKVEYLELQEPVILPTPEAQEKQYQEMWKAFFKALTIEERRNYALQRSNLPKRYWEYMVEMQD